jgi:hypothetical protein
MQLRGILCPTVIAYQVIAELILIQYGDTKKDFIKRESIWANKCYLL